MTRSLIIFLVILLSSPCFSQVKNGNGHNKTLWQKNGIVINDSQGHSIRQNARIASLPNNISVIVWEDNRNGFTDILAQMFNANGQPLWGKSGVAVCKAKRNQTFPQIIISGASDVIITWQDYRNEYSDIYAQKLDSNGNLLWGEDGVPVCKAPANQLAPQLASDGTGGAIITWYDYRSGKGEDVYAQMITSSGTNEWQLDGVPVCVETGTQWYPKITSDGTGGAVICWDDRRSDYYDIYTQRLDAGGNPVWQMNGIPVCAAPENQQYSQIGKCGNESFIMVWQDYRQGNADIYCQKVDLEGKMLWKSNGEPVCNVAGNQEQPQLIEGETPIVVWTDFRNGSGNSDIFCQKISSNGKPSWFQYGVAVCEAPGNQSNPKGASDGENGAVIVWQDQRSNISGIFARRINKEGKALWVPDGKTVCMTDYEAEFPQISTGGWNEFTIVWQDKRHGGLNVYAQGIDITGALSWKTNGINITTNFGSVTQQKPRVAKTGKDEYVIVFEDYRNGFSNIYAQKINNNGKLLWNIDGIRSCNAESNHFNPELVADDDGGVIIVWEDLRSGTSSIYAQRIDTYGNKLWDENGILICPIESEKINPKITKDGKQGAIIVWQDGRKKEGLYDIFAQRIDRNGSLLWKVDGVDLTNSPGVQTNVKVELDGDGGAIATWVEYRGNINTPDIFAQRIDSFGRVLWSLAGLGVCKAPEAQRNPDIAVGGDIIIVWEDSGGGNYDIYAQKINKDGTVAWKCDGIPVCTAPYTQHEPKLVMNEDGGATITWEDYRKGNWDIFAQRIDPAGNFAWTNDGMEVCISQGTQYSPQLVKCPNLSTIVVWEDYRNNKNYNVYAQKISKAGEILWDKEGTPVCISEGGARNPQVVDDSHGGAIVVWTDYRFGSYDIYAQRVNENQNK